MTIANSYSRILHNFLHLDLHNNFIRTTNNKIYDHSFPASPALPTLLFLPYSLPSPASPSIAFHDASPPIVSPPTIGAFSYNVNFASLFPLLSPPFAPVGNHLTRTETISLPAANSRNPRFRTASVMPSIPSFTHLDPWPTFVGIIPTSKVSPTPSYPIILPNGQQTLAFPPCLLRHPPILPSPPDTSQSMSPFHWRQLHRLLTPRRNSHHLTPFMLHTN